MIELQIYFNNTAHIDGKQKQLKDMSVLCLQKLVMEWPKPELAHIPSTAIWDITPPSALLDWLTGTSPAWIFITTVLPSFLTAGRKVKFARGEQIAGGCSLHVEMQGLLFISLQAFPKRISKGRVVGHGWVGGCLEWKLTRFKDLPGSSLCLGRHLIASVHDSTSLIHVNWQS